jgi:hypothetical protein
VLDFGRKLARFKYFVSTVLHLVFVVILAFTTFSLLPTICFPRFYVATFSVWVGVVALATIFTRVATLSLTVAATEWHRHRKVAWIGSPLKMELVMAVLVFLSVWTLYDVASTRSDNTDSVGDAIPGSLIDAFEDVYAANAHWCATNARGPPRFNTSGTAFFGGKGDPQVDGAGTREGQGAQVSLCGRLNLLDHCAIPRLRACGNSDEYMMVPCVRDLLHDNDDPDCDIPIINVTRAREDEHYYRVEILGNMTHCIKQRSFYLVDGATQRDEVWVNLFLTTQWTIFTWLALESGTVAVLAAVHGISAARRYGRPRLLASFNARKMFSAEWGVGLACLQRESNPQSPGPARPAC